jgi:TRAP transporter TAXI family solute receptor
MKEKKLLTLICSIGMVFILAITLVTTARAASKKEYKLRYAGAPTRSSNHLFQVAETENWIKHVPNLVVTFLKGQANLLMQDDTLLYRMHSGLLDYKGKPTALDMRLVYAYGEYKSPFMVTKASGIKSVYELDGKRFAYFEGSEISFEMDLFLKANGIKPNYVRGKLGPIVDATKNRVCIGWLKGGVPDSAAMELAAVMPIRLLDIPDEAIRKAQEAYPGVLSFSTFPANIYPGQNYSVKSFLMTVVTASSKELPEDLVYQMVKVSHENRKEMSRLAGRSFEVFADWPTHVVKNMLSVPLHAGTVKFLRELGVKVPDRLVPPEAK